MTNNPRAASAADPSDESLLSNPEPERKVVYWHRELPPLAAEPLGEYIVEANSVRVIGDFAHDSELWERCYRDVLAQMEHRLKQELHRLGGHYAHVLEETIGSRRDDHSSEVWLHGRIKYLLLSRPRESADPFPGQ